MKIKTSELQGAVLDWAVAKCEVTKPIEEFDYFFLKNHDNGFCYYSTNWAQGGPIIEREKIDVLWVSTSQQFVGSAPRLHKIGWRYLQYGPTPLIAAMRCYVASKLGAEVAIKRSWNEEIHNKKR